MNQKIMNTLLEIKKDITEIKKDITEIKKNGNNSKEQKKAEESYLNVRILLYFIFYIYINKN
jgi:septal ring factor EnvC (AmiA/AmiB activator)